MDTTEWPDADRRWVRRYLLRTAAGSIPPDVLAVRVEELRVATGESGLAAYDALGDPDEVAAEDLRDLGTVEQEIADAGAGGLRSALRWIGVGLTAMAAVNAVLLLARSGWTFDLRTAPLVLAVGLAVGLVAVLLGRVAFLAGRLAAAVAAGAAGLLIVVVAAAIAVRIGRDALAWAGAPTVVVAAGALAPGLACLLAARLTPPPDRTAWTAESWSRRFRTALISRGVARRAADGHVAEAVGLLREGAVHDPGAELGDPVVLARRIGAADPSAGRRRDTVSTGIRVAILLVIAFGTLVGDTWGPLRYPVAGVALVIAVGVLVEARGRRTGRSVA